MQTPPSDAKIRCFLDATLEPFISSYRVSSATISADIPAKVLERLKLFGVESTVRVFDEVGNNDDRDELDRAATAT